MQGEGADVDAAAGCRSDDAGSGAVAGSGGIGRKRQTAVCGGDGGIEVDVVVSRQCQSAGAGGPGYRSVDCNVAVAAGDRAGSAGSGAGGLESDVGVTV